MSAEDDLLRIFGSDRMKSIMSTLKVPEDEPIEHSLISRSLQTAQKRVEGYNFDTRKHVLQYDDVMNKHREVVYKRRQGILLSWERVRREAGILLPDESEQALDTLSYRDEPSLKERLFELIDAELENVVGRHTSEDEEEDWNTEEITEIAGTICPMPADLRQRLDAIKAHAHRGREGAQCRTEMIELLMGLIREAYEVKEHELSSELMRQAERMVLLRSVDTLWIDHLDAMEALREGIGLRGYGQKDPLVEYKREGFALFQELLEAIQKQSTYTIFKIGIVRPTEASPMETQRERMTTNTSESSGASAIKPAAASSQPDEPGRNDPCPCGSGKKYKKCHGA